MTDVKELRIGNIANCYSSERKENIPFYVEQIFVDEVYLQNEDEGFQIMADRLDGIPLTEELLLKCDVRPGKYYYSRADEIYSTPDANLVLYRKNNRYRFAREMMGVAGWVIVDVNGYDITCFHQLQNIYYALTGKELEVEL